VAALEHLPVEAMAPGPSVGVRRKKTLHSPQEVGLWRLQHDVQVIRHDDERIDPPRAPDGSSNQIVNEAIPICIDTDNILPPVATGHEMIDRTRILNA
jgi:hypothetical protein